ncbi:MAG: hypothetical protein ABH878_00730 [bacterium]
MPHIERWGIYSLDLTTDGVALIYSSPQRISGLRLNHAGNEFVFSHLINSSDSTYEEICTINPDGTNFQQITDNLFWDLYPCWSSDVGKIAFLTWRNSNLDIYVMNADGSNQQLLYDSGNHDADIDWMGSSIAYTQNSQIWTINDDGTQPIQITSPPNAGQWGNANLPFGDYDPRISPAGSKIIFERLEGDSSPHGNYNFFLIDVDGTNEIRLTDTGYAQGLANWSHSGNEIVFIVAAIDNVGKYDIYRMNADGSNYRNSTPDYFPTEFLCRDPVFSGDDAMVYFIGEWWE